MGMRVDLKWHGPKVDAAAKDGAVRGLKLAGEHLLTESRAIVPHEWGDLERDGKVSPVDESDLQVVVYYGLVYAVRQHQELDWHHAPGREAEYLKKPFEAEEGRMKEIIAAQIRRSLRS